MLVVCDIETNRIENPDKLWVVVCTEVLSGDTKVFHRPDLNPKRLLDYFKSVTKIIGHYFLRFDLPQLRRLVPGFEFKDRDVYDTLVFSKMITFSIPGGHSLEAWGERLGHPKVFVDDYDNPALLSLYTERCIEDVQITKKIYQKFLAYLREPRYADSFRRELDIDIACRDMEENGFTFDYESAIKLQKEFQEKMDVLSESFKEGFPPRKVFVKLITPRLTKNDTISLVNIKPLLKMGYKITDLEPGVPVALYETKEFNPGSVQQIVERMWEFGWKPVDKTEGHTKYLAGRLGEKTEERTNRFKRFGWMVNETNLGTLPEDAPESAQNLREYLLLKSRLSTLTEWFQAYNPVTGKIHGKQGLGTWTHRNNHTNPNTGNITPSLRHLWTASEGNLLVGVDAKSIQARGLAHYLGDKIFSEFLAADKDIHEFNAAILGCPRRLAKTWYYAWIMGASATRLAHIMEVPIQVAKEFNKKFLDRFPKLRTLKHKIFALIEEKGYFIGIDNRLVLLGGYNIMSGLLQNLEKVVMSEALLDSLEKFKERGLDAKLVGWVHDEFQFDVGGGREKAREVAEVVCQALRDTTEKFHLLCPMDGSYHNDDGIETIGFTWKETH